MKITICFAVRLAAIFITVGAFAGAPAPAQAADKVPFRAFFATDFSTVTDFPTLHIHVTGAGKATHMGAALCESTDQTSNLITGEGAATYYLSAANGDQ